MEWAIDETKHTRASWRGGEMKRVADAGEDPAVPPAAAAAIDAHAAHDVVPPVERGRIVWGVIRATAR